MAGTIIAAVSPVAFSEGVIQKPTVIQLQPEEQTTDYGLQLLAYMAEV